MVLKKGQYLIIVFTSYYSFLDMRYSIMLLIESLLYSCFVFSYIFIQCILLLCVFCVCMFVCFNHILYIKMFPKVKPKHRDRSLVAGCIIG